MDSFQTFRQSIAWTRSWLNNFQDERAAEQDDFEIIEGSTGPGSDYGVESLSDHSNATGSNYSVESLSSQHTVASWPVRDVWEFYPCPNCGRNTYCECCGECWTVQGHRRQLDFVDHDQIAGTSCWKDAIDYEIAGRNVENTFRDLRSASKARRRKRTKLDKYFYYKHVKPGWLNAQHYECYRGYHLTSERVPLPEAPVVTMNKQTLYREAQGWPRPPTYHRRRGDKDWLPWTTRYVKRKKAQKHARQGLAEVADLDIVLDFLFGKPFWNFPRIE